VPAIGLLASCLGSLPTTQAQAFEGKVLAPTGITVGEAMIIVSGQGSPGWQETDHTGVFRIDKRGAFFSIRHVNFKPRTIRLPEDINSMNIRLEYIDDSVWRVPRCSDVPQARTHWVGQGLRVRKPDVVVPRTATGQHDVHWYIETTKGSFLHVVDGLMWHTGLPLESWLLESAKFTERGWTTAGGEPLGVDLAGDTPKGNKWRWVADILGIAISYYDATADDAAYFDGIIESMCAGQP
jgi:hypothetical protein